MAEELVLQQAESTRMADRRAGGAGPEGFPLPSNGWRGDQIRFYIHPAVSPKAPVQRVLKRLIDAVFASLALLVLAPVLLLVAALIKLDSKGPIFARQLHTGLDDVPFYVLRFRCEHRYSDAHVLAAPHPTPLGRILLQTRIERLPQLWNVLAGDMSLVGPSPHVPDTMVAGQRYGELVQGYEYRHRMRPGLTGLAQARNLHGPAAHRWIAIRRIVCDVDYIRNFSLVMDVKIISRTLVNAMKNATAFTKQRPDGQVPSNTTRA
jgi:lipopolysaccharide/colanic/teichoic acid biosynthesis glycosyltransferase